MAIPQITSGLSAPQPRISRRTFLKGSATTAVAIGMAALSSARPAVEQPVPGTPSGPLRKGRVIDCHAHLNHRSRATWEADDRKLIEAADKLGIDQLCCSTLTPRRPTTADGFRECNRWTADGMRRFPGRVLGYCYVNPGYGREALEEVRRCVGDRGFIGIKLYNVYTLHGAGGLSHRGAGDQAGCADPPTRVALTLLRGGPATNVRWRAPR